MITAFLIAYGLLSLVLFSILAISCEPAPPDEKDNSD